MPWLRSTKLSPEPFQTASNSVSGATPRARPTTIISASAPLFSNTTVVDELDDLAAADLTAMRDIGSLSRADTARPGRNPGVGAHHDAEFAALRGFAGARHRRIGEVEPPPPSARADIAGDRHRRGAERSTSTRPAAIRRAPPRPPRPGAARQRQEEHRRPARRVLGRGRDLEPLPARRSSGSGRRSKPRTRRRIVHQMGADRLAHDAQTDAADHGLFAQPSPPAPATRAALGPGRRPAGPVPPTRSRSSSPPCQRARQPR